MQHEWQKQEKALYLPGKTPALIEIPAMRFITIQGAGNPNEEPFSHRVGALYALTFTIRMMPKKGITPEGYAETKPYPLEGVWDLTVPWDEKAPLNKDALQYTLMIRQPSFVTPEVFSLAMDMAKKKKDQPLLEAAAFETLAEGLCVQTLHEGPYDDEPASFARLNAYMDAHGLRRVNTTHREIYLKDPRKTKPENMRTVLRYQVMRG